MTSLLDSNMLIALVLSDHIHHETAEDWFAEAEENFATCPITQGSLVRLLLREGHAADTALHILTALTEHDRHEFWQDAVQFSEVKMSGVIGHRQVTDAYLAQLARAHQGQLVTLDKGLAGTHSDVTRLIQPET